MLSQLDTIKCKGGVQVMADKYCRLHDDAN